ncbi:MAG: Tyrosine-protein kinase YwqD [Pedosphaera sp.]|nr:Tyrosine-protein kinase YwqD [Pedosphaera sp.]
MNSHNQLNTSAVDLLAPANRFVSASRLYGRMHRWWLLLGRYWWVTVLALILVLTPVYFLTASSAPAYESKARMWLTGKLDIYEGRLYTEELINFLGTQAELLRSPAIQNRALDRLHEQSKQHSATLNGGGGTPLKILHEEKAFGRSPFASGATASGNAPPPFPFQVKVLEGSKSSTLELRAVGAEPDSTRAFLDDLMEEYLSFKKESREKTSERTTASLATEVAQLKRELEVQQEKLHAFQSSNNIVFLQEQGNSAGSYLASLNRQLATLRTELRLLKSLQPEQWTEMKTHHGDAISGESSPDEAAAREMSASLAEPQLELFKANQQMELLKSRRDELSRFLRPAHPKIIKLNEEIATQKKLVQISRDEALNQLARRRQAVELQVQNLEASSKDWDVKAIEASRKMADYEQIRQNLQRLQAAYDKTLALIQTVDVSKKVEQENVGILEPASVAISTHRRLRNMAIALAASLLLGFGLLYCIGLFQDDFTSLTELANQLSEEAVGQIPAISIKKPKGRLGIDALEKQRFEFLEAFRSIRSSLLFMNNGGTKPKTIIVTSSVPEEGKSTVALYLAATLAKGNSRVLLVDADMRRATLHKFFDVASNPGLAEILNEGVSSAKAVPTGLANLWLLPAGEARRNPGELVLSSAWTDFLTAVKPQFDYILVDTPPVLATDDAATLAPTVDGVLFVVRGSFTSARMARGALDALRQRQVHVLGLVFNRAASSPYEHHYYQRYRHAYRWEPEATGSAALADNLVQNTTNT